MAVIEITSLEHPGVEVFSTLTEAQLRNRLDPQRFVRISHSEMVNLDQVRCFDLNLAGTICIRLADGKVTYVSRRYVSKIKQILGV